MKTTAKNRLLASFMGFEIQTDPTREFFGRYHKPNYGWLRADELHFHYDYNWIMQVVEKIESLLFKNDEYYNVNILGGACCLIISSHGNELIANENSGSKLEAVYNACVEFVIWYNKNKEQDER